MRAPRPTCSPARHTSSWICPTRLTRAFWIRLISSPKPTIPSPPSQFWWLTACRSMITCADWWIITPALTTTLLKLSNAIWQPTLKITMVPFIILRASPIISTMSPAKPLLNTRRSLIITPAMLIGRLPGMKLDTYSGWFWTNTPMPLKPTCLT